MDGVTAFGVVSVGAMLLFYWLEDRWRWALPAFACACWSSAVYGWLVGAWPFTIIETVWGVVALRRYLARGMRI